jgi:hypothetical protein
MKRSTRVLRRGLALLGLITLFGSAVMHQPRAQSLQAGPVAWMLFFDDMHLDFRNTGRLRTFARTVVNELAEEGDLFAIRTSGPSAVLTDFSASGDLLPHLKKLAGNGLRPSDIIVGFNSADREERYRTDVSLSAAISATAALGQADHARRGLIYISNGYPFDVAALAEGRALAHVAASNSVRIFVVDGRVLDLDEGNEGPTPPEWTDYLTAARTSLRIIAEQSGGFAVFDRDEMPAGLKRISSSMR